MWKGFVNWSIDSDSEFVVEVKIEKTVMLKWNSTAFKLIAEICSENWSKHDDLKCAIYVHFLLIIRWQQIADANLFYICIYWFGRRILIQNNSQCIEHILFTTNNIYLTNKHVQNVTN